jgi:magnesium chelatase subunit H
MLIALPEIDGATNPTVFGGRHGPEGCNGLLPTTAPGRPTQGDGALPGADRQPGGKDPKRLAALRRKANAEKKVGIVLFGFPPNAGAIGTAAYLSRLREPVQHAERMKAEGYDVEVPASVEDLRDAVLHGNAKQYGQEANVAAHVDADTIVRTPPLKAIESVWGPAPGKIQSTGAACSCWASISAMSSSACSRPSATRATRCAFCSRRASRRRMPSRSSTCG